MALTRVIPNSEMFMLHTSITSVKHKHFAVGDYSCQCHLGSSKLASKQATTSVCVVLYVCIDLKGLFRSVSE